MRTRIPLAITAIVGLIVVIEYFIYIPGLGTWVKEMQSWGIILGAFALGLAAVNLLRIHSKRVTEKQSEWYNSLALVITLVVQTTIGLAKGTTSEAYLFGFTYIMTPLGATIFALLAFYIASAGYRAFQAKNIDASILLITSIIVMLGAVPVGQVIWKKIPVISGWLLDFPNMAGQRGIIIGSAIGAIALGIRVILGIERGHLGGSK